MVSTRLALPMVFSFHSKTQSHALGVKDNCSKSRQFETTTFAVALLNAVATT